MKFFTGIGSRRTPGWSTTDPLTDICAKMVEISKSMSEKGYTLRSGGADGADLSFELGASSKEIWVPWPKFNWKSAEALGIPLPREEFTPLSGAFTTAALLHPNWAACNYAAKKLHARNVHQVLGKDLKTPSDVVFYWTNTGGEFGGTATALRLAKMHGIECILVK